jgi:hypothetical protein
MADKEDKRSVQFHFWATDEEAGLIWGRMRTLGISNLGAYMRKAAIDGYFIQMDLSDIKEVISLIRRCSANINQVAKHCNEIGAADVSDVAYLRTQVDTLWAALNDILKSLAYMNP